MPNTAYGGVVRHINQICANHYVISINAMSAPNGGYRASAAASVDSGA
jgi:hypothetical protein